MQLSVNASVPVEDEAFIFDPADLTKERSLWQIWLQIRRIPESKFNQRSTGIVFLLLLAYAAATPESTSVLADRTRGLCDFGFNFAGSVLGFLIAGFTIFATMSRPGLFLEMAKRRNKKTRLSYLKTHFFNFMKTFCVFFFFVCVCLLVKIFAAPGGAASVLLSHMATASELIKRYLAKTGIVSISTMFFYLVILLQSFIYNVYSAIMTSLRWEAEFASEDEAH